MPNANPMPLSTAEIKDRLSSGIILVDTRDALTFTKGFIPGSISVSTGEDFTGHLNKLFLPETTLMVLATEETEEKILRELEKTGFENTTIVPASAYASWVSHKEPFDLVITVEPDEFAMDLPFDENMIVIDTRNESEYAEGHVKGAINLPVSEINDLLKLSRFEEHHNLYLYCSAAERSVLIASVLKKHGIHNLRVVTGGLQQIQEQENIELSKEASLLN